LRNLKNARTPGVFYFSDSARWTQAGDIHPRRLAAYHKLVSA